MTRVEAYHILGKMWEEATPEQAEAICLAQNDIEFVDLMPDDMVAVVRCKDCVHKDRMSEGNVILCTRRAKLIRMTPNDFCSYGKRKGGTA